MLEEHRRRLVGEVAEEARETAHYTGRDRFSDRVMEALGSVPRHLFVPEVNRELAYENRPLPIGADQTISQPYIVALMTDLLDPRPGERVLEIGTGCGYQTAVLAAIADAVYSIEVIADLADRAARTLEEVGVTNAHLRTGNGRHGWPEAAPFDKIMVTAGADDVPDALVEQLNTGGRMVIPVDTVPDTGRFARQELIMLEKTADGALDRRAVLPVAFVPLVHGGRHDYPN